MGTIRSEQLSTGPFYFYDIDSEVSKMIKPIFVLCVFIAAIRANPFRQNDNCKMACGPCEVMEVSKFGTCKCYDGCPPVTTICKAGKSPEYDTCGCKTCRYGSDSVILLPKLPKVDAEVAEEVKTALEEEAQEEKVEKAENRSQ